MKKIFFYMAFLVFTSCVSSKKFKTSEKLNIDSTQSEIHDSTTVKNQIETTQLLNAKDIDIKINYSDSTDTLENHSVTATRATEENTQTVDPFRNIINDAISNSGIAGKIPTSIEVHIGSLNDSSTRIVNQDSSSGKQLTVTKVQEQKNTTSKSVDRKGLGFVTYGIIGIAFLIAVIFFILKYKAKLL